MASNQPSGEVRNEDQGEEPAPVAGNEDGVELSQLDVRSDGKVISEEIVGANPNAESVDDLNLGDGDVLLSSPQLSPEEIEVLGIYPLLVAAPAANEVHTVSSDQVDPSAELPDGDLEDAGVQELEDGSLISAVDGPVDQTLVHAEGDGTGSEIVSAGAGVEEGTDPLPSPQEPEIVSAPFAPEHVHTVRSDDSEMQAEDTGEEPVGGSNPDDGNSPEDGSDTGVLTNDRPNAPLSVKESQGDLTGLASISEVTADSLEERLEGSALEFSVVPKPELTIEPGMVKEANITICDGIAMVKLTFEGNNLEAGTDGDSTIEFGFGPVAGDEQATIVHDRLTDILNGQTTENATLEAGTSITEHTAVKELLRSATADAEFNATVSSVNASNASIRIEPDGAQIFKDAVLGGSNGLQRVLNPDNAATTAPLSNVTIEGAQFAGVAGNIENSTLQRVTVLNGDIDITTDADSKIDLIARGSSVHGDINCELAGDFRGATLGSKERPIRGTTFSVVEGQLQLGEPPRLKNFVVDLEPNPEGVMHCKLNDAGIDLSGLGNKVRKLNVDAIQDTGSPLSYLKTQSPVSDAKALLETLRVSNFSDNPVHYGLAGNFQVEMTLKDQDPTNDQPIDVEGYSNSNQPIRVDLKLTPANPEAGTDPAVEAQDIPGITPERALYIINQLQRMDADADIAALQVKIGAGATPFSPPVERDDLEEIDRADEDSRNDDEAANRLEPTAHGAAAVIGAEKDALGEEPES